jgi:hypothetical protein
MSDVQAAFHDFAWRMHWRWLYRHQPESTPPRFYVRSSGSQSWDKTYPDIRLRNVFTCLERCLVARTESARLRYCLLSRNVPRPTFGLIRDLRYHPNFIVRLADKNMGLCLVSRKWYVDACLGHLLEPRNFSEVVPSDVPALVETAKQTLVGILRHFRAWSNVPGRPGRFTAHSKYLDCKANDTNISVPVFYGLIKVHKTPTALRPIVACHSWLTTPVSCVCAYELHVLIRRHLPHVLEDSKSLVRMIEGVRVPRHHSVDSVVLVTGDVEGLYVNIPILEAINACVTFVARH